MLTPKDIASQRFSVARLGKGYDQKEVDDFLDEVLDDYGRLYNQLVESFKNTAPIPKVPAVPIPAPNPPNDAPSIETISLLLKNAEATAKDLQVKAEEQANQIVGGARVQADKIVTDANNQAASITYKAHEQRDAVLKELDAQKNDLSGRIEALQAAHDHTVNNLKGALAALTPQEGNTNGTEGS